MTRVLIDVTLAFMLFCLGNVAAGLWIGTYGIAPTITVSIDTEATLL